MPFDENRVFVEIKCSTSLMKDRMSDHLRDTVFGQAVRLVSHKRRLQFPDELDPATWKQFIRGDSIAFANASDGAEKAQEQNAATVSGPNSEQQALHSDSPSRKINDIILVDWYNPDDREVGYLCVAILSCQN